MSNTSFLSLPVDVILGIFKIVFKSEKEGQVFFYSSMINVSNEWTQISLNPMFWKTFDNNLPIEVLKVMCENGCLLSTENLTFPTYRTLNFSPDQNTRAIQMVRIIFRGLPKLKAINFSKVNDLDCRVFECITEFCTDFCELKLSDAISSKSIYIIDEYFFDPLLSVQVEKLVKLDISNVNLQDPYEVLLKISDCQNLEYLNLLNVNTKGYFTFPLIEFQQSCTKMKVLLLAAPATFQIVKENRELNSPGFALLEEFMYRNFAYPREDIKFSIETLLSVIHKSTNLIKLDIRGHGFTTSLKNIIINNYSKNLTELKVHESI